MSYFIINLHICNLFFTAKDKEILCFPANKEKTSLKSTIMEFQRGFYQNFDRSIPVPYEKLS